MSASTFAPFTLESTFDPLQSETPPPPRRRPAPSRAKPPASPPADIGAGNRLAHLLPPGDQPATNRQRDPECAEATTEPEATTARLVAFEDDVAILAARLDNLHTAVTARLDDQREKLVKAVAAMLDERLGPRR